MRELYISTIQGLAPPELKLGRAIILAESQQRPRWFRKIERIGGSVIGVGTYGVAQVAAPAPISDKESIDELMKWVKGITVQPEELITYEGQHILKEKLLEHNPDPDHSERIIEFVEMIDEVGILPST